MEQLVYKKPDSIRDDFRITFCPGCDHGVAVKLVAEVLDELGVRENTIGIASVGCSVFSYDFFNVDIVEAPHGRSLAVATGVKRSKPDKVVFTYQGDGDLASIGIGETIHAMTRGEKVTAICINNTTYGMTGGQAGPTTLIGQVTTTTTKGRQVDISGYPLKISELLKEVIVDELFMIYVGDDILSSKLNLKENKLNVILFVGVNGVGKTTSIAKIAKKYKNENKKIMLIAADTFRAGAVTQLKEWSQRIDVGFFGDDRKDPSAVIYDGLNKAKLENYDLVLIDTAGRLQNKINLMKELEKMNKVIGEIVTENPVETLLVIDATTGQNGISQAKSFKEITNITGIILTKLDSSAKGGIVLAIKELVNIPVKFVGLGEKETDLIPFDIEKYIYGLFKEF